MLSIFMFCYHGDLIRERCPGQKECEEAIRVVNSTINMLDQAALAALSQDLKPNASSTQQVLSDHGDLLSW